MATQYSCLENPMDRGAWWAIVYRVAQSWTRLKRLSTRSINESRSHHDGVSLFPLGRKMKSMKIIACWRGRSSHRCFFFHQQHSGVVFLRYQDSNQQVSNGAKVGDRYNRLLGGWLLSGLEAEQEVEGFKYKIKSTKFYAICVFCEFLHLLQSQDLHCLVESFKE